MAIPTGRHAGTLFTAVTVACSLFLSTNTAFSQTERLTPRSTCQAVAHNQSGGIRRASSSIDLTAQSKLGIGEVSISYVAHSTFRIEDATGLTIATDYSGTAGPNVIPDVVTMNHAHITHFTPFPDKRITHVLPGWQQNGKPAQYNIQIDETIIRNVTTDISSFSGHHEKNGNSIFIFEMGGLCIGHLGHLHHLLTDEHYAEIGRLDVLMVPVDGGVTMNFEDMAKVVKRLNASVVLPMHAFSSFSLNDFLQQMGKGFPIEHRAGSELIVSLNTLPTAPTLISLQPEGFVRYYDE
ncbi:MAG: MBL fold metallo-hydrolase [Hyphomicrobiales bacterium]